MKLTAKEREHIRNLAKRQAEIAMLPIMEARRKKWYKLNNGETSEPLVSVEFNGLRDQFFPQLICQSAFARDMEWQFNSLYKYYELHDDRVIPGYFSVPISNDFLSFDLKVEFASHIQESMGYAFKYPIENLEQDFHLLKKSSTTIDNGLKRALSRKHEIEEIIGDIMPVRLESQPFIVNLGYAFCTLMGMENMFIMMYDYPELFHKAMAMLTADILEFMDAIEGAGAILPNNDGTPLWQGSFGYTNDLPSADEIQGDVKFSHLWGYCNFQETTGMNPEMFDEFFFSYMEKITNRFGLFSYGCCEPVDELWDLCLSRLKNLRKLSVSAWCNEAFIAEKIRGKKIVYHRKPSANFISVDAVFDEEAFCAHIAKSVKIAKGCPLEVTFREELTLKDEPWRLKRAVELVREQFITYWQG